MGKKKPAKRTPGSKIGKNYPSYLNLEPKPSKPKATLKPAPKPLPKQESKKKMPPASAIDTTVKPVKAKIIKKPKPVKGEKPAKAVKATRVAIRYMESHGVLALLPTVPYGNLSVVITEDGKKLAGDLFQFVGLTTAVEAKDCVKIKKTLTRLGYENLEEMTFKKLDS